MNGVIPFQNLGLQAIMVQVVAKRSMFNEIYFRHVFQELNTLTNQCSKKGVDLEASVIKL
jgi:hypothetical protein